MQTKTTFKVETWCPVFSGFYGTIWETDSDEESEMQYINDMRKQKHLPPVEWDAIEWDYKGYTQDVSKGFTCDIEQNLQKLGLVKNCTFQKLNSPREYNFANDSIHVEMTLTGENVDAINAYLHENKEAFTKYIEDTYTSRDGFCSSYSNDADEWLRDIDDTLRHTHKLGAVLNFILLNEDDDLEMSIYEHLHGNGCYLHASNYSKLTEVK